MRASKLTPEEYFHYFKQYIDLVDDLPLIEALENGFNHNNKLFESLPISKHEYRYAEGKWTPKEILLHLIDTERVFCYRALYFSRAENSSLEGFDENIFGKNCGANERSMDDLLQEYLTVRTATLSLFRSFTNSDLRKRGKASNNVFSVGAIGFILCGHEKHHQKIIEDRYL